MWRVLWHNWRAGLCIARRRRHLGSDCSRSSPRTFSGGPGIVMTKAMIRVVMPAHLRTLAGVTRDVTVEVEGEVTRRAILDALETQYPMLRRTILCRRRSLREQNRFSSSAQSRAVDSCYPQITQIRKNKEAGTVGTSRKTRNKYFIALLLPAAPAPVSESV